ncbi:acetyl-CoA C-acetyltransferase [Paenibacillus sp. SI8]|uniref:acetyl-CoA C-acetyltransferase n=1 Tax=unclassified Paenibacillus TaxID=185978 RepID=UPI003465A541
MRESVIVSGARTPFGKFGGALKEARAVELGGIAIKEAIARASLEAADIDEVLMGMVLQAGAGQIPSRQAARLAGLSWQVTTETINKVCASGMRSVTLADQIIRSGDADTIVAGGMESMSNAPYMLQSARWGARMGNQEMVDAMAHDGLLCAFEKVPMIVHGSHVAAEFGISRSEQDEWALRSHQRAIQAINKGFMAEEIGSVPISRVGGTVEIISDEAARPDTSLEKLAALTPLHASDGTITAGNAPGVNDGAAALSIMSLDKARSAGVCPLAVILGHTSVGDRAPYIATTPALAIQKLLKITSMKLSQIDRFEVNEAFAAVPLICGKLLGWDAERVNVNGGAVALGHPIAASGTRIILTLIHELRRIGGGYGIAAICSGAAQGDAILLRVDV